MKKYLVVSLGVLLALALAVSLVFTMLPQAADAAAGPNPGKHYGFLSDPIQVTGGYVAGTTVGDLANPCRVYRGIPYAAPPVGDLRWKDPQPVVPWTGIRQCTTFPASPIAFTTMPFFIPAVQSEDCLTLNLITPAKRASQKLPVMVYFHGGGYSLGSGNEPWVADRTQLAENGVVTVYVNERLGALGLLCHPLLNAEAGHSGNYLFLDLIQSLKWVKANIAAFGGDPNNVTIFGQSGGSNKVSVLMASPLAKGLFHRAICMSLSTTTDPSTTPTEEEMYAQGEQFFEKLGVTTLAEARAKPWEEIVAAATGVSAWFGSEVVDGYLLEATPTAVFQAHEQNAVPLMVSTVKGELSGWEFLIPAYVLMLQSQWELGVPGYALFWDQVPANWRAAGATCGHSTDMCYVFGDMSPDSPMWTTILPMFNGGIGAPVEIRDVDRTIAKQAGMFYTQFAKTGNPSVKKVIQWPTWDPSNDRYLFVNDSLTIQQGFSEILP